MAKEKIKKIKLSYYMVNKYRNALLEIFKDVDGPQRPVLDIQIERVVFLLIECEELEKIISEQGTLVWYENGSQKLWRENPASKIHVAKTKVLFNFLETMKKMLPETAPEQSELVKFMNKNKLKAVK